MTLRHGQDVLESQSSTAASVSAALGNELWSGLVEGRSREGL